MENRYDRVFWEFEQKHKEVAKSINRDLRERYNFKKNNGDYEKDYLNSIYLNFHLYSTEFKKWIIENILPYYTKETLISYYLIYLMDALMAKDEDKIISLMTSIKQIGLIKDIKLHNNSVVLVTNDNEIVKLKNLFSNEDVREEFKNRCHSGCEFLIKNKSGLTEGSYIITVKDKFVGKKPIYHSVILSKKGYIIDPARNMIMKLSDYEKLLKPQVIMCMSRKQMLDEIENLKATDEQFNQSNLNNVLKLTINKQLSKI